MGIYIDDVVKRAFHRCWPSGFQLHSNHWLISHHRIKLIAGSELTVRPLCSLETILLARVIQSAPHRTVKLAHTPLRTLLHLHDLFFDIFGIPV